MTGHSFASTRWLLALILVALLVTFVVAACGTPSGEKLVEEKCTRCHTETVIEVSSKPAYEWFNTVYRMKKLGAAIDAGQADAIVEYLASTFGPASSAP